MRWPSAELELLLLAAAQAPTPEAKQRALEHILPICAPKRLALHPFHPGVLHRLHSFAESLSVPSDETAHLRSEIRLLTSPTGGRVGGAPIDKLELLALTLLGVFLFADRPMPAFMWVRNSHAFFGAPTTAGGEIDESLWATRFTGDAAWTQILERLDYLQPWRHIFLDALRRLYYTSLLFCDRGGAYPVCVIPVRVDRAAGAAINTVSQSLVINGGAHLVIDDSFSSAALQAAAAARSSLGEHEEAARPTLGADALTLDFTLADKVIEGANQILHLGGRKILLEDTSASLPIALAYHSRLIGRLADGPVIATGSVREDGAVAWQQPTDAIAAKRLSLVLDQKLTVARQWLTYDRLFVPANTPPERLEKAPPSDLPLHALRVASVRDALQLWQDQSQRVMSLMAKVNVTVTWSSLEVPPALSAVPGIRVIGEKEIREIGKQMWDPLPGVEGAAGDFFTVDGFVHVVVSLRSQNADAARDDLHMQMRALAERLRPLGLELEGVGNPEGGPRRFTNWNVSVEANISATPCFREAFRIVRSPTASDRGVSFRDRSRFPF